MKVIAIDGYTGTGKGTTASAVADRLDYLYLDTGAMYRAATYVALRDGWIWCRWSRKSNSFTTYSLSFIKHPEHGRAEMYVDGLNIESAIRDTSLGLSMKAIVTCRPLRQVLEQMQRSFALDTDLVADGRDMGTVVFPDAQWKFFLICDLDTRVARRYDQLLAMWKFPDRDLIRKEIQLRDDTDYLWSDAVNHKADDAIIIDTTYLTIQEQVEQMITVVTTY
jgi:cytidylate kinase